MHPAALHGGGLRGATHPRAQNRLVINTPPSSPRSGNSWKTSRKTRDSALRLLSHVRSLPSPSRLPLILSLSPSLVSTISSFLYPLTLSARSLLVSRHIIRNRELYSAENGLRATAVVVATSFSRFVLAYEKERKRGCVCVCVYIHVFIYVFMNGKQEMEK